MTETLHAINPSGNSVITQEVTVTDRNKNKQVRERRAWEWKRWLQVTDLTADLPEAACYAAAYVSATLRAVAGLTTVWMWVGHAYQRTCGLQRQRHSVISFKTTAELPTQNTLRTSEIFKTMIFHHDVMLNFYWFITFEDSMCVSNSRGVNNKVMVIESPVKYPIFAVSIQVIYVL